MRTELTIFVFAYISINISTDDYKVVFGNSSDNKVSYQ